MSKIQFVAVGIFLGLIVLGGLYIGLSVIGIDNPMMFLLGFIIALSAALYHRRRNLKRTARK